MSALTTSGLELPVFSPFFLSFSSPLSTLSRKRRGAQSVLFGSERIDALRYQRIKKAKKMMINHNNSKTRKKAGIHYVPFPFTCLKMCLGSVKVCVSKRDRLKVNLVKQKSQRAQMFYNLAGSQFSVQSQTLGPNGSVLLAMFPDPNEAPWMNQCFRRDHTVWGIPVVLLNFGSHCAHPPFTNWNKMGLDQLLKGLWLMIWQCVYFLS